MEQMRLSVDTSWIRELLTEVNSHDIVGEGGIRNQILDIRQHPSDAFHVDCECVSADDTSECRVFLKPSEKLLKLVFALRTLKRQRSV